METIQTDQEVDQFIWSFISESRNPQDFVAFCQHAVGRDAGHELALQNAERYWYELESPALFPQAVAALEALANEGNTSAMFHLGRWYRMGIGVTTSSETGLNWYRRGMDLGDLRCQVNIARYTALSDTLAATRLYQQAIDLGYDIAHCFWADIDKNNKEEHLRLAAQSGDAFAMYCYGYHLVADSPAEERSEHMHWIRRAADAGDTTACIYLAYEYKYPKTDEQPDLQTAEQWLLKGVRLGAIGCIGLLGRDLMGTYENITEEGFKLLQRACILGDPIAQSTLGFQMAWWGKSAEDQKKGVAWLHAAALQDHKIAIFRLGEVWEKGRVN
jgi:TPR repeat protein